MNPAPAPQPVVVTGGTGLIGRHLVAALRARGVPVVVFTRRPEAQAPQPGVTFARWTPHDPAALQTALRGAAAVFNLVGANIAQGRWTKARKAELYRSRVDAGRGLAQAIAALPAAERPAVFLQMSAVGYYGDRGDQVLTEDAAPGDDFLARLCVDWEAAARPVADAGVRYVVLRTGVVLAREGGALPLMVRPIRWFVGGPLGDGRFYLPWIHIADQIAAMLFLMDRADASGPFNLTAPEPVPQAEFVRTAARLLHRPAWLPAPKFALRLVLGELADALTASLRAVPARLQALGFAFRYPTLEAALQDLLA
ncbi:MAG: TIGR01777 family protein [Chloroflexi bacterium]|nr:TIGR01777 family protein [Chloroflexota bacterium]